MLQVNGTLSRNITFNIQVDKEALGFASHISKEHAKFLYESRNKMFLFELGI